MRMGVGGLGGEVLGDIAGKKSGEAHGIWNLFCILGATDRFHKGRRLTGPGD